MTETDRRIALTGTTEPPAEIRRLRAGGVAAELVGGELRHIACEGIEVIRAIQFLIRDVNWGTYPVEISDLSVDEDLESVSVRYHGRCGRGPAFVYEARISRPIASVSWSCIRWTGWPALRCAWTMRTDRARKRSSRVSSAPASRSSTSGRSPTACAPASRRAAPWRATPTRWRTSGTGPTPRTRPTSARSRARPPIPWAQASGSSSR